jgi:hypothetical protein
MERAKWLMSRVDTVSRLEAVLKAVANKPNGATLIEVAAQLSPFAAQRNVQRWLAVLVEQNRVVRVGLSTASRYKLRDAEEADDLPQVSVLGQSIWRLVNQPANVRTPSQYHRDWLDAYRPNQTYFIPEQARTELRAPIAASSGAAAVTRWREPGVLSQIATDLAWRSGWLEAQGEEKGAVALSMPDVAAWLTQPESMNVRRDVQLVWNQRTALNLLLSGANDVALTYEWLTALYGALTKRLVRSPVMTSMDLPSSAASVSSLLRTESVVLARSVYLPPAEPWVIETCFNQVMGWAPAIADPIEQAFFVFVHLLYLQPFAMLNAPMACLAMNIPLLRAGLPPVTFAGVRGADLFDGMRGVWELNRTELLRDVFIAACNDCRARYGKV